MAVRIAPERRIDDDHWVWHVGLDAEASGILNDLYNRVDVDEARARRLLSLFRLEFVDRNDMRPAIAGRPVYLAMAMDAANRVKLKPQNLLAQPTARPPAMTLRPHPPMARHARRALSFVALLAAWTAFAQSPPPAPAAPPAAAPASAPAEGPLADFAWLAGCWRGTVNQREFREHWMPLRGNLMLGTGHTVAGNRTQDFEYIRLEPRGEGVFYVAAPSGQKEAAFRFAERTMDGTDAIYTFVESRARLPATHRLPPRQRRLAVHPRRRQAQGRGAPHHLSDASHRLRERRVPPAVGRRWRDPRPARPRSRASSACWPPGATGRCCAIRWATST